MSKNINKIKKQISSRKGAVDVFLNGVPAVSIWSEEKGEIKCKVFEELSPADFKQLAWCLAKIAGVLVKLDSERVAPGSNYGRIIQLPGKNEGGVALP